MVSIDEGPIYTRGDSYRARAEKRQREYRSRMLGAPHGLHGHFLADEAARDGSNFLIAEAHDAAKRRQREGKGVSARTFKNMLSSQAMCFNLFAPLSTRLQLAGDVLRDFVPGLAVVSKIEIEHTPSDDVFGDQSGLSGVDCDLLVEGHLETGAKLIVVIETKFVEPEFSVCGFRKAGRERQGKPVCPDDVPVRDNRGACLYDLLKGYGYWRRSDERAVLREGALPEAGCPFVGGNWQLWVNFTLAHVLAECRGASEIAFAVCTSARNTALLGDGEPLEEFRSLVRRPESVRLIDLDQLIDGIKNRVPAELYNWAAGLSARYQGI